MPRAEAGSSRDLANRMKSRGLQRLRWYCQVCEKQCRDDNGFKCHTQSESHVRAMQTVGADARGAIRDFSAQFDRDFLRLLRTAHGTKTVHLNKFYQEYIADKEHVHMNATQWPSLTEFAKHLGRGGICRVEETDKGLHVAWIDNSPAALRRQAALQKRERQDRTDEELEQRLIREQIERAGRAREGVSRLGQEEGDKDDEADDEEEQRRRQLSRPDGERIKLSFGVGFKAGAATIKDGQGDEPKTTTISPATVSDAAKQTGPAPIKLASGNPLAPPKPKNVFSSAARKGASKSVSGPRSTTAAAPVPSETSAEGPRKVSAAERIMRAELEGRSNNNKRPASTMTAGAGVGFALGSGGGVGGMAKRQRVG